MNFLMIALFLWCSAYAQVVRTIDISEMNPLRQNIGGIEFPRMKDIKYRGGTEAQYSAKLAVLAMLGADEPVESILYSGLKLLLMKEKCNFCSLINPALQSKGFDLAVQSKLDENSSNPYSVAKAREIAFKIMEADLKKRLSNGSFIDDRVDYLSPRHEIFPQDVVFSTVHLEVANIYSRFITVFKESQRDALDLNYWNKSRNNGWIFVARKWVDRGEFITPIRIEANNVIGFYEYLSGVPDYTVYRPLPAELDYAYMKEKDNVLIFDGKILGQVRATAIVQEKNDFVLATSQFDPLAEIPKLLKTSKDKPRLIGIIKLCPVDKTCKLASDNFKKYARSYRNLHSDLIRAVTSAEINGLKPKIFYTEGSIDAEANATAPYTVTYPSSDELMNKLLVEENFKSQTRISYPTATDKNKFTWDLGEKKLPKNAAIYIDIPDSVRKKKLLKVTLLQRQDEKDNTTPLKRNFDASPAYTSVQFYALTENGTDFWRYLPNPGKFTPPKDAFFADIKSVADMKPASISVTNTSMGYKTDAAFDEQLSVGAVRLLGLGTDPATLYSLELEFEE